MYQGPLQDHGQGHPAPQPAILMIVHQESSDPGRIGDKLRERGYRLDIRRPCLGQELPVSLDEHAGCVMFGGPMSANDDHLEFIRKELDFIPRVVASGRPFLGVCLGAQLLARAGGGKVGPHPDGWHEIGYYPVKPTPQGRELFPDKLHIFQWHGEGFSLPRGGIVGIIGPNGAGKTTLFRMLTGQEKPDAGEIRIGPTVKLAYVDQSRHALDPNKTVWEEISGGLDIIKVGNYETPSRSYVGRFNFKGPQQQQRIGELSGGERNRVHLAKVLKSGGNVLLLDEPTNDLDVETLRALEEALLAFPGCAVVISHDRWFLDRIATHILAFEGNSEVVWFEGNFQEYMEDLRRRKGEEAAQPHRIRYKPLTR